MEHYDKAIQLNPDEMMYINNKAACHFALHEYENCIELCDKALEVGKRNSADCKRIGRALSRKGMALEKIGRIDDAINCLKASLFEQSDDKVKLQLRTLERKRKNKDDHAYTGQIIAVERNTIASDYFNRGDYDNALVEYNEAIRRYPNDINYLSNRAVCLIKLQEFYKALCDLENILEMDTNNLTALVQKGFIHSVMKEYGKALECYDRGLMIDPENKECKEGFKNVVKTLNFHIDCTDEERLRRKLADPQIQNILSDPHLVSFLEGVELSKNPNSDPKLREAYLKLVEAGIKSAEDLQK